MNRGFIRKRIKAEALVKLGGNWLKAVGLIMIQFVLSVLIVSLLPVRVPSVEEVLSVENDAVQMLHLFLPEVITKRTIASVVVTLILYLMVMAPLSVGIRRFFIKVSKGEKGKFSDAFSVFTNLKTVFSSVWLEILVSIVSGLWLALFMAAPLLLIVLCMYAGLSQLANLLLPIIPAAALFAAIWNSRYIFSGYILAEGNKGAFSAFRECLSLVKGRNGECLILRASYLLWDVAATYIFPLTYIYNVLFGTVYADYLTYLRGKKSYDEPKEEQAL